MTPTEVINELITESRNHLELNLLGVKAIKQIVDEIWADKPEEGGIMPKNLQLWTLANDWLNIVKKDATQLEKKVVLLEWEKAHIFNELDTREDQ